MGSFKLFVGSSLATIFRVLVKAKETMSPQLCAHPAFVATKCFRVSSLAFRTNFTCVPQGKQESFHFLKPPSVHIRLIMPCVINKPSRDGRICFNFLMNGIVRASIHIYNYKQASVHKTDEVVRSCQVQLRESLQTNPTWTQPVKKSARVKRVASFLF